MQTLSAENRSDFGSETTLPEINSIREGAMEAGIGKWVAHGPGDGVWLGGSKNIQPHMNADKSDHQRYQ
jgi:hypothetical protein